jgi:hypothetical protein
LCESCQAENPLDYGVQNECIGQFLPKAELKPAFHLLCPIKIYVSKHKLNYTIGWSKSGKETYCKGCFKPTTQRAVR